MSENMSEINTLKERCARSLLLEKPIKKRKQSLIKLKNRYSIAYQKTRRKVTK